MLKVIIDTNIVISAMLKAESNPAFIVSLALQKKIKLCLSHDVLSEYENVLRRKKFHGLDKTKVNSVLKELKKNARFVKPATSVKIIKQDLPDNRLLECAAACKADYLITGNTKHFSFPKFQQTKIVTPSEFLVVFASVL